MHFFFAGAETHEERLYKMGGRKFLYSYYYIRFEKHDRPIKEKNFAMLLDSGGFTIRTKGKFLPVESFAEYLNENQIRFAFNLDTRSLEETWSNQEFLEKNTSTYIIPIFHLQTWKLKRWEYMDRCLQYPYFAIAGLTTERDYNVMNDFFHFVYSRTKPMQKIHALGKTQPKIVKKWPFYSVDSTSWLAFSRYAKPLLESGNELVNRFRAREKHWSQLDQHNVDDWFGLEAETTKLWCARNVHLGCDHDKSDFVMEEKGHELARNLIGTTERSALELQKGRRIFSA